jgi:hypothetical protein
MTDRLHGLLLVVVLVAGCAGTQAVATLDPALRLRERVRSYWDARIASDLLATYTLHEPAFRRTVTLTAFLQGRGVTKVLEHEILGEQITGDLGIVKVKVKSTVTHSMLVKPVEPSWAEFEEQWVRVDGEWYRKFRFPVGEPYPDVDWDAANRGRATSPLPSQ